MEVSVEVVIDDGAHAGPGRRTALRLLWSPEDPYAVALRLTAWPEHPALPRGSWVLARETLQAGLSGPAGEGVVRVRPDALRDRVWFELERLGRPACVSVPRDVVTTFLARTEAAVPTGDEQPEAAIDRLLRRVLNA